MEQSNWEQQRQVQEFLSKLCSDMSNSAHSAEVHISPQLIGEI